MVLYHKKITFDFSSNSLLFEKKGLKKKQYLIDIFHIISIVSGIIQRVESDRTDNLVTCHYFSIVLIDNTEVRMCETTSKEELEDIINIILKNCRKKLQWKHDTTVHDDNKLSTKFR